MFPEKPFIDMKEPWTKVWEVNVGGQSPIPIPVKYSAYPEPGFKWCVCCPVDQLKALNRMLLKVHVTFHYHLFASGHLLFQMTFVTLLSSVCPGWKTAYHWRMITELNRKVMLSSSVESQKWMQGITQLSWPIRLLKRNGGALSSCSSMARIFCSSSSVFLLVLPVAQDYSRCLPLQCLLT